MKLPLTLADARRLAAMPPDELADWLAKCTPRDILLMDSAFEMWAHQGQLPPQSEGWRVWLMIAGRGFGKTRAGAEWIHTLAMGSTQRIGLVGATIDEARRVMVEGLSGLLAVARRDRVRLNWEPSLGRIRWPHGSIATLYSGDNPDGLRGPEHHVAWADELAKWRCPDESWNNLQLGLRAGMRSRVLVTTTPRPMPLLERIKKDEWTVSTGGRTCDNVSLSRRFINVMTATYGGTRIGRQELDGELLSEAEGSLFPRDLMERARVEAPADFDRIVVGVDPPASTGGNACGIVVAGRADGKLYVLADCSVDRAQPERWASAVARAAEQWGASHVVAEGNQGGAMVKSVLKAADIGLKVKLAFATRGKSARAEPQAIRFETGKAFLAGTFPELEAELAGLMIGGGYDGPSKSPDRADAMVWALAELGDTRSGVPRIRML
jgi:phage terminase large subunit-like protein